MGGRVGDLATGDPGEVGGRVGTDDGRTGGRIGVEAFCGKPIFFGVFSKNEGCSERGGPAITSLGSKFCSSSSSIGGEDSVWEGLEAVWEKMGSGGMEGSG